jgi:hypothetical protein
MNKKLLTFVLVLVALIALFLWFRPRNVDVARNDDGLGGIATSTEEVEISEAEAITNLSIRDRAWNVLTSYLDRARNHDIAGVKALSHEQSATCADAKLQKECFALMDNVFEISKEMKKENFVNVWQDKNQIILSTELEKVKVEDLDGYERGYAYFTVDEDNNIKVLNFNPNRGWYIDPKVGTTTSESIKLRFEAMMLDTDEDGLPDEQESCSGSYLGDPHCTLTDPKLRDTDKDGWWDGVEYFFKN